jgi:Ras-related protein Rab-1A
MALLVYDITNQESWGAVQKWRTEIDRYAPECPVALVGNKYDTPFLLSFPPLKLGKPPSYILQSLFFSHVRRCDLTSDRQVTTNDGQELADQLDMPFYEVSAKSSTNIDAMMTTMVEICLDALERS